MSGWDVLGVFYLGFLSGVAVYVGVGRVSDRIMRRKAARTEAPTHRILIANTRTDDGARLLGDIEDEYRLVHEYGVGSGWRPEIHFHGQGV